MRQLHEFTRGRISANRTHALLLPINALVDPDAGVRGAGELAGYEDGNDAERLFAPR
jgi:hypothetical protein